MKLLLSLSAFLSMLSLVSANDEVSPMEALRSEIATALAVHDEPLFHRHLQSVLALSEREWALAQGLGEEAVAETSRYIQTMIDGLRSNASDPAYYLEKGRRSLVMAFPAKTDGYLDFYSVSLPPDWDPAKTYPVIVGLHGYGPGHPLFYASLHFGALPAEFPPVDREHISIQPWGRGNLFYRGVAESSVWESLDDARKIVHFDPDHTYLSGHSMGGFGTWNLSLKRPDQFAAIAIIAGGPHDLIAYPELTRNLANTPVLIWHGDSDPSVDVDYAYKMQKALTDVGNPPTLDIIPEHGHETPNREQRATIEQWLLQHKLERPQSFTYSVCDFDTVRVWGVQVDSIVLGGGLPSFTCTLNEGTVTLETKHVTALSVDTLSGLGLSGEIQIILNGQVAYEGVARDGIQLNVAMD